jgi:peptidoglycan/LPS O-acetylase OafA/YrhL
MAHSKDIGKPSTLNRYLIKRVIRVYPVYWVFLTLYIIAAGLGLGSPDFSWEASNLIKSYLLFPPSNNVSLPLQVAWTLFHEILFYLVFVFFILNKWLGIVVFTIWMILVVIMESQSQSEFGRIILYWNVYFVFGMFCFLLLPLMTIRKSIVALIVGIASLVFYMLQYQLTIGQLANEYQHLHVLLAVAFSAIILGVVGLEKHFKFSINRVLLYLGDASYSIYLVHSAVISVLVIIGTKMSIGKMVPGLVIYLSIFVISVISGCIAYSLVESPLLRYLQKRFSKRKT